MVVQKRLRFTGVMLASLVERLMLRLGAEFEPARLLGCPRANGTGWAGAAITLREDNGDVGQAGGVSRPCGGCSSGDPGDLGSTGHPQSIHRMVSLSKARG